jgi:hypothetical protein
VPGVKRATSSDAAGNHHSLARLDRFPVIIEDVRGCEGDPHADHHRAAFDAEGGTVLKSDCQKCSVEVVRVRCPNGYLTHIGTPDIEVCKPKWHAVWRFPKWVVSRDDGRVDPGGSEVHPRPFRGA